jgi:transcriptional regulator with XRE-family HTH domain
MITGTRLLELRKEKKIIQRVVADFLGVSVATLSNYENGIHYPPNSILLKLCDYYEVSADYLLGRTECRIGSAYYNRVLANGYTLGDCVDLLVQLDDEHLKHFIQYLELTQPSFQEKRTHK